MKTYKKITEEIKTTKSMKGLLEAYEEIAASKMKKIRDAIITSREYYHGLAVLSDEVGADLHTMFSTTKAKEAVVLLSANESLYGEILDKVFVEFLNYVKKNSVNVYIAGKVGEQMMKELAPNTKYTAIEIINDSKNNENIQAISKELLRYKKVKIFYGEFASIVNQKASSRLLSGEVTASEEEKAEDAEINLIYLYEPDLSVISKKFGEEIFVGILEQTTQESLLAQQASRLMHLDGALAGIDKKVKKLRKNKFRFKKRMEEKKQNLRFRSTYARRKRSII